MDALQLAREYSERGAEAARYLDPTKPHAQQDFRRAWDQLNTAAENIRYAAIAAGLKDPREN